MKDELEQEKSESKEECLFDLCIQKQRGIKMKERKVILGEFESELYAKIARRELIIAGIKSNIIKERIAAPSSSMQSAERVRIIITDNQLEEAQKVLATKFI